MRSWRRRCTSRRWQRRRSRRATAAWRPPSATAATRGPAVATWRRWRSRCRAAAWTSRWKCSWRLRRRCGLAPCGLRRAGVHAHRCGITAATCSAPAPHVACVPDAPPRRLLAAPAGDVLWEGGSLLEHATYREALLTAAVCGLRAAERLGLSSGRLVVLCSDAGALADVSRPAWRVWPASRWGQAGGRLASRGTHTDSLPTAATPNCTCSWGARRARTAAASVG